MKTQMRFQKYICLAMIIVGALALVYAFCYATGGLAELGQMLKSDKTSFFKAAEGKYDATLFLDIQGFNDTLMYCGIVMILLAVCLYITSCHKRRNYYVTNYVATGVCAGGNIIISVILMAMNGVWMGRFNNIDFEAWAKYNERMIQFAEEGEDISEYTHYSESTTWFTIGFVVYVLVIVASVLLILNLVWKIMLMQGEKKLLNGTKTVEGGAV
ncbi:MAG: hypothetical protein K2N23_05860 [Clostridia bacterium]|nr:hypothetical protein [Clostridia bacterium]